MATYYVSNASSSYCFAMRSPSCFAQKESRTSSTSFVGNGNLLREAVLKALRQRVPNARHIASEMFYISSMQTTLKLYTNQLTRLSDRNESKPWCHKD
mmetsp:Transcript_44224/g.70043  ORF Transcript_44224/g.70043 Transcript_44224/m.70043 type:complete len:98 (-) Transcript_44224:74-367(-)